ncbi:MULTISPECIES: carbohydrate ABC transporter permease [unclassified Paenibacillus]|uniref:carbohydrate ABC transporter permease n=1 Tax=unclassified Paenibacillus TaxID=185978 RepID=UPI0024065681|nr:MULTISPECIES: carbohydrate ABC transporter permease [unclassified Paenibacillus]MDF9839522.1 putative aldouronate transport system permease protein [Paenibacillus sp. PastF-2]MDF9846103.1 putative aldouronate transport system permease protein [Paenibacillus sp. PastM-2]MDF9852676.1 putative aldouronate transport system permease protein [Paenibacillus sp. PastF-1]MDH6477593.1 putative aldouronate transport system permease protein [Paenibacillus sp. PastH-2]MDH6505336.1 putative aldouronate t
MQYYTKAHKGFTLLNYMIMIILALICIVPFIHYISISLSSTGAVQSKAVGLWPVGLTFDAYKGALQKNELFQSLGVTVLRTFLSTVIGMSVTVAGAYALSKGSGMLKGYRLYITFFIIALLFNGGLIPNYILINSLGLMDTIWAVVLPTAANIFNMILLLNFFKAVPQELEEAGLMDGASHWVLLLKIFIPLSLPAMATVGLFVVVNEWNSWFDGSIYLRGNNIPLATYLQSIMVQQDMGNLNAQDISQISTVTLKAAQVLLGTLPILIVYPFLQRFFVQGAMVGAVKE